MKKFVCFLFVLIFSACGRYQPPFPPEALAPTAVKDLLVYAQVDGIKFEWVAPDNDQRGEEIKKLNGYQILRKTGNEDDYVKFVLLDTVEDNHIIKRDELRKEAREKGFSGRRIDVVEDEKKFSYTDLGLEPGIYYYYKIIGFYGDDIRGAADQIIRVKFLGNKSEISSLGSEGEYSEWLSSYY